MTSKETGDAGWVARLPPTHDPTLVPGGQLARDPSKAEFFALWDRLTDRQLPGPGWTPLIDELHERLIELDPKYELLQVKEKMGGLRFYARFREDVRRECHALVRHAEARAARTCERCGEPGALRMDRRWKLTLCDACDVREAEGRPEPTAW